MKLKSIILISLIFIITSTSYSQWIHQQSGVSTEEWRNVEFLNENYGFICGYNSILKTTTGGDNWINLQIPSSQKRLYDISIVNENIIYVAGNYGTMLKTTNGGENWESLYTDDTLSHSRACHFINENTGWFAGTRSFPNFSFLVKTTDGGNTFTSQAFANIAISDIYFKDANTGIMVSTGQIWKSTNGGTNWYLANINFHGSAYDFNRFGIVNDQYCWLVSYTRPVYRSTDFGDNWDSISYIPSGNYNVNSTFFISQNTGWAGLDFGKVYKTTDSGFNWFECSTPQPSGFISDIFFLNENTGWAVEGNHGNIFKTTNGGCNTVGIVNSNIQIPQSLKLYQNFPNPFNPSTNIQFDLPKEGIVTLKVYDMLGREVAVLINEFRNAGRYIVGFNGSKLSSGVYYYRITAGDFVETKRMVLIK